MAPPTRGRRRRHRSASPRPSSPQDHATTNAADELRTLRQQITEQHVLLLEQQAALREERTSKRSLQVSVHNLCAC